jgi:hypothetical protein
MGAMSTDGEPDRPPADGAAADEPKPAPADRAERERAVNALAYPLAGTAAAGVVVVVAMALIDPTPGRHVRGLLILLALVGLVAVACGWARTIWHGTSDRPDTVRPDTEHRDAEHRDVEEAGSHDAERRDIRHVE